MSSSKFVRVMSTKLKKATIDEAAAEWLTHLAPFKKVGMERAYMFVDRETGAYLSVSIWESRDAQANNSSSPAQVAGREAMTKKYFEAPPTPATFELVAAVE